MFSQQEERLCSLFRWRLNFLGGNNGDYISYYYVSTNCIARTLVKKNSIAWTGSARPVLGRALSVFVHGPARTIRNVARVSLCWAVRVFVKAFPFFSSDRKYFHGSELERSVGETSPASKRPCESVRAGARIEREKPTTPSAILGYGPALSLQTVWATMCKI